jgi:dolichol-phosphate mannosyltransferase
MISLVIPTLNELENIEPLLSRILRCEPAPDEIIFVDDGSTDGTRERIRSFVASAPVRLIERDIPRLGLSGAVIAGARAAQGDLLVVMDADLSHPPERMAELLGPISVGVADMVIGSRYVRGASTPDWPFWRKILSRVAAALAYPGGIFSSDNRACSFSRRTWARPHFPTTWKRPLYHTARVVP